MATIVACGSPPAARVWHGSAAGGSINFREDSPFAVVTVTKQRTAARMPNPSGPDQDATPEAEETPAGDDPQAQAEEAAQATEEAKQPTEEPAPEEPAAEESGDEESGDEESAEAPAEPPDGPSEAPTEVITPSEPEPEFESAKPTEIMQSPPEPPTEGMSIPGGQPRLVAPQAIPPRPPNGRHRSWALVLALILVIAALAAVAVFGTVWLTHTSSPKVSQEDQVRQTIHEFDNAVQKGDLAQLRGITCGTTRDGHVNYDDQQWAATHEKVIAAKRYPMVASIDEVAVDGQHAEANVTTFIAYEPQVRSTRSFDLQFLDGRWKICQGPIG